MSFQIAANSELLLTDPTHDSGIWCSAAIKNPKPGQWESIIDRTRDGIWGSRISCLTVIHKDFLSKKNSLAFRKIDKVVGVNSCQAGAYDKNAYDDAYLESREDFLKSIIGSTLREGVYYMPFGVTVFSGYGNGDYEVQVAYASDSKTVIAAKIDFVGNHSFEIEWQ